MKLNFFNIACFRFLISTSCNKEPGPFSVSGAVVDYTTNQPIADATVYLLAHEKDGDFWSSSPSFIIDTTISDAHGKFSFSPKKNDAWGYSCLAEKELYFTSDEYTADGDYALTVNVYLKPKAWLSVHLKAINEYDPSDFIDVGSLYNGPFYGNADTTEIISINGNSTFQMTWFLFEGGIETNSETDFIYCPAFDTTYHEIFY